MPTLDEKVIVLRSGPTVIVVPVTLQPEGQAREHDLPITRNVGRQVSGGRGGLAKDGSAARRSTQNLPAEDKRHAEVLPVTLRIGNAHARRFACSGGCRTPLGRDLPSSRRRRKQWTSISITLGSRR
jgi:hypothetical protein